MQEFRAEEQCSADAKAAESVEEAALTAELDEAQVQLQAAERAAEAAKKANEADIVKQVGAEAQRQDQLRIEAQEWRVEMDAKQRKMEKAHDLVLQKEQIGRIKRKAQEAKRHNEEANDSLLGDISAQLNG
jgi:hypothetical protein